VLELFDVSPALTWPYEFLNRHSDNIILCLAIPQKESRINVTKVAARRRVQNLIEFVRNIHMALIFNIDEVESEEWAERKPKKVFVPAVRAEETVHHALKRGRRRVTAIVTISIAGDVLTPLLVIHRHIIDHPLWQKG
jgi:hypothetical protein